MDDTHSVISQLTHDLKSPLTVISAYAQLIIKQIEKGEAVDLNSAKKINQTALDMAATLSDLAKTHRS